MQLNELESGEWCEGEEKKCEKEVPNSDGRYI